MNETQFIQLGQEVLHKMQQISNFEEGCKLFPKLGELQRYIFNNPDNEYVKQFITVLLEHYINLFFKKELVDAFNLPEKFHYYKQIAIYSNLPYTTHPLYAYYLPRILVIPSTIFGDFYRTFLYILEQYQPDLATNPHLQAIQDFVSQNQSIIKGSKDDYYSLSKEIELYKKAYTGILVKELEEFGWILQSMDHEFILRMFLNKRIGNIGELYAYQSIRKKYHSCFVSRDIKNGFGYDIFFFDHNYMENLVEVKTTMNTSEDDFFSTSENEYQIMQSCFHKHSANYYICRIHLDYALNPSYTLLTMKDDETLTNDELGIQYKLQPSTREIYFRKQTQKRNHKLY